MIDKEKLKKAQEWAGLASEMAQYSPTMPERAKAAAEVIKSLPDEWIDADNLREALQELDSAVTSGHGDQWDSGYNLSTREWAQRLKKLLPAPPTPRTMAEIEWDDAEHHLAEATVAWTEGTTSEVVMLHRHGDTIAVHQSAPHYTGLRQLNPAILTPTGRKYRMEREDDVASATGGELTTQDVVDECRAVRKERAAPEPASPRPEDVPVGEAWQVEVNGRAAIGYRNDPEDMICWTVVYRDEADHDWMHDGDVTLIARLVPETTEQDDEPEFDPTYTYRDKDGDEWRWSEARGWHGYKKSGNTFSVRSTPPVWLGPYYPNRGQQ